MPKKSVMLPVPPEALERLLDELPGVSATNLTHALLRMYGKGDIDVSKEALRQYKQMLEAVRKEQK